MSIKSTNDIIISMEFTKKKSAKQGTFNKKKSTKRVALLNGKEIPCKQFTNITRNCNLEHCGVNSYSNKWVSSLLTQLNKKQMYHYNFKKITKSRRFDRHVKDLESISVELSLDESFHEVPSFDVSSFDESFYDESFRDDSLDMSSFGVSFLDETVAKTVSSKIQQKHYYSVKKNEHDSQEWLEAPSSKNCNFYYWLTKGCSVKNPECRDQFGVQIQHHRK